MICVKRFLIDVLTEIDGLVPLENQLLLKYKNIINNNIYDCLVEVIVYIHIYSEALFTKL